MPFDHSPWWKSIRQCRATTQTGARCKLDVRPGYEVEPGHVIVLFTCSRHADQEDAIRKERGLKTESEERL
jgi:hypothetical protein